MPAVGFWRAARPQRVAMTRECPQGCLGCAARAEQRGCRGVSFLRERRGGEVEQRWRSAPAAEPLGLRAVV